MLVCFGGTRKMAPESRERERERIVTRPEKVESPLPRAWFTLVRLALHSLLSRSRERLRDSPGPSGPSICLSGPSFLPRLPVRGPTGSLCLRRRPSFARWHRPRVYSLWSSTRWCGALTRKLVPPLHQAFSPSHPLLSLTISLSLSSLPTIAPSTSFFPFLPLSSLCFIVLDHFDSL